MELPGSVAKVLRTFASLDRESKMQALLHYSKKLEPFPEELRGGDATAFAVPECQTPVAIVPVMRDGRMHFFADLNARQSPTVAAFLAIVFSAVNDEAPDTTLALPDDFARQVMDGLGLAGREVGLNAIVARLKRHARYALAAPAAPSATQSLEGTQ